MYSLFIDIKITNNHAPQVAVHGKSQPLNGV